MFRRTMWTVGLVAALALAIGTVGAVLGRTPAPCLGWGADQPDRLQQSIAQAQQRLRRLPGDWQTWAQLSLALPGTVARHRRPHLVRQVPDAATQSSRSSRRGTCSPWSLRARWPTPATTLAAAQQLASTVVTEDPYNADAYSVLVDAETQLGHPAAATDAVQHLLDLRPGLPAYARASYDLEQRGLTRRDRPDDAGPRHRPPTGPTSRSPATNWATWRSTPATWPRPTRTTRPGRRPTRRACPRCAAGPGSPRPGATSLCVGRLCDAHGPDAVPRPTCSSTRSCSAPRAATRHHR